MGIVLRKIEKIYDGGAGARPLARMPAVEQVELPLVYAGIDHRRERAQEALVAVGLAERMQHKPTELSGGQAQRVAIARALVADSSLILADEPTGALDSHTSVEIMGLFQRLNPERGITVAFVTHEPDVAAFTRRTLQIRDGAITSDQTHPMRRADAGLLPDLAPGRTQTVRSPNFSHA